MKNFFTLNRRQTEVFVTIIVLLLLVSGFYFGYVPSREKKLNAQFFRSLGRINDNLKVKLDNHYKLLENYLDAYLDPDYDSDRVREYLKNYSSDYFELSTPSAEPLIKDSTKNPAHPSKGQKKIQPFAKAFERR